MWTQAVNKLLLLPDIVNIITDLVLLVLLFNFLYFSQEWVIFPRREVYFMNPGNPPVSKPWQETDGTSTSEY